MAGDVDLFNGIALTEGGDLIPVECTPGMKAQQAPNRSANSELQKASLGDSTDESLVALVSSDDGALDALFNRYSRLVFRIALRILHDVGEAEEVVQECFLYIFRKAFTFEPSRGSAKVWIVQVAYSRALDRKAHLARRGFYFHSELDAAEMDGAAASHRDAEGEIGRRLDFDRLVCAFDRLPEMQRMTLQLFYFEQLELREISERLGQPLGNIRHHFYRGLERLRKGAIAERLRDRRHATP